MNTKQRTTMILVLLLSLVISSCAPGQIFGPTAAPTLTSTPAATSTPVATSTPTESPEEIITDAVETACQMKPAGSPSVGVSTGASAIARLCPDVDPSLTLPDERTAKTLGDLLYVVDVQNVTETGNGCGPYTEVINGVPTGPGGIFVDQEVSSAKISIINTQTGQVVNSASVPGSQICPRTISDTSPVIGSPSPQDVQEAIVDLVSNLVNFPILNTLTGHTDAVTSVAFSLDGKLLAAGSYDKTVMLWDVASGQEVNTLTYTDGVTSVAFSPDRKLLAAGSGDNTVILWDVASGQEVNTLKGGHTGVVRSVAFSPDGKLLAAGSSDNTVMLWDVASGQKVRTLTGHTDHVTSVTFSPDGKLLASGSSWDHTVILWDLASGKEVNTLTENNSIDSVSVSPDGKLLAASSTTDSTAEILWDVASGQEVRTLAVPDVTSVTFSPDGKLLAAASGTRISDYPTVTLWDVASGQEVGTLNDTGSVSDTGSVFSAAFSPDGKLLAIVNGFTVTLLEVKLP